MKKVLLLLLSALLIALPVLSCLAEGTPPEPPSGMGTPPGGFGGGDGQSPPGGFGGGDGQTPPSGFGGGDGQTPPGGFGAGDGQTPPEGFGGGMPGGSQQVPESYSAVSTYDCDTVIQNENYESSGADECAVLVTEGNVVLEQITVSRISDSSTGGDSASFYGVGSSILATGGNLTVSNAQIHSDSKGGAGVFAYGNGVVTVNDTIITTSKSTSGGIHVAGGGTLYANNITAVTEGESSAAIRSDRGGGKIVVSGGSFTSNGSGSPAVYVTADIEISDATLTATSSEALCLEGKNSVSLTNCSLSGNMPDQEQNDNTWTVILYQSMSGDSELGKGSFRMTGGSLISSNGGLFYTTNTQSEFYLENVTISTSEDSEYFLRCTGNLNARGWGQTGSNGAVCDFTAAKQQMSGNVLWDSVSELSLSVTDGSTFTGSVIQDESCTGNGGNGQCAVTLDATSTWIVTGNSVLTSLTAAGTIRDPNGNTVSVLKSDGTVVSSGSSEYTITLLK